MAAHVPSDLIDPRQQLLAVVGLLGQIGGHDDLRPGVDCDLCVVPLKDAVLAGPVA
jgi:hypothetical protein